MYVGLNVGINKKVHSLSPLFSGVFLEHLLCPGAGLGVGSIHRNEAQCTRLEFSYTGTDLPTRGQAYAHRDRPTHTGTGLRT